MSNPVTYEVCCHNLNHDGDVYQPGEPIELTIDVAQPLLNCKPPAICLPVEKAELKPDSNVVNLKQKPDTQEKTAQLIEQAIKGMEVNDANYTNGGKGKPDAKVLTELLGWSVSAKERDAVWDSINKNAE